jgi:hypothetical protein
LTPFPAANLISRRIAMVLAFAIIADATIAEPA